VCRWLFCRQAGQGGQQRAALLTADPLQQALFHDPDVGLRGGVAGCAGRGDPDKVGAPVSGVRVPVDRPVLLELAEDRDEAGLVGRPDQGSIRGQNWTFGAAPSTGGRISPPTRSGRSDRTLGQRVG